MNTHSILINSNLHGLEYGMLRDFEAEICRITNAERVTLPYQRQKFKIGTRYQILRQLPPKTAVEVPGDVIWSIMMGPENCTLDQINLLTKPSARKILYLYDTFAFQVDSLRYILKHTHWDLLITSFEDAIPMLETATGRTWHAVHQGVRPESFQPPEPQARQIGICSYGRRDNKLHEAIKRFASEVGIYYDFTTWKQMNPEISNEHLYKQYAWHLRHSMFCVNIAVEVTSPARAGALKPITCRWFEAAAAGTIQIGCAPSNPKFNDYLPSGIVNPLDLGASEDELVRRLKELWDQRKDLQLNAAKWRSELLPTWTWETRVHEILKLL